MVKIVNSARLAVIAESGIFPRYGHDIGDPASIGPQQIALQCDPVAVPRADLQNGLYTAGLQEHGAAQGTHAHDGIVHIGDHKGVDRCFRLLGVVEHEGNIGSLGWNQFRQDCKFTPVEFAFEMHPYPSVKSSDRAWMGGR